MTAFEPNESPGVRHKDPAQSSNTITESEVERGILNRDVQLMRISLDRETGGMEA